MKPALASSLIVALGVAPAVGGTLADALERHAPADVASLRARRDDAAARCTLGAVYARRADLPRAALYLAGCEDLELPAEISTDIARTQRELKRKLRESDLAILEVVTAEPMTGEIDSLPGETFATPATLYVAAGSHTISATHAGRTWKQTIRVVARSRGPVILGGSPHAPSPHANDPKKIDFTDDHGAETQTSGPPPDVKHGSMIKGKLAQGLAATGSTSDDPEGLQDPFAIRVRRPRTHRPLWLGVRLGGGMFDDGATPARPGAAVALAGRYALGARTFLAGRLDWSRRGGDAGTALDVLGASAGAGRTLVDARDVGLAVIAQLRGDLRLAGDRGTDLMTTPVERVGVTGALGLELALPRTPFTAGLRFEQGLTPIVSGARDRAMLVELGVDWR